MIMTNSKKVLMDINCLRVDSKIEFKYKGREFRLRCFGDYRGEKDLSVFPADRLFGDGMNVEKISNKYLSLYTFDMMGTKTKYKMSLEEMEVMTIICAE